MDELTWKPAWQLRDLMASGELPPVEVTDHFLARIEKLDPVLRAFAHVDAAGARAQAARAQRAAAYDEPLGPLHGIPVGLQIIGKPGSEATIFRAAAAFQAARPPLPEPPTS